MNLSKPLEGIEIQVPSVSDAVFKYTWHINKYKKIRSKRHTFDSPPFEYNANGDKTKWNVSIRYWTGPHGQRVSNPVVICLNLLSSQVKCPSQTTVKYQFGIYNHEIKQWEMCPSNRTVFNMECTENIISIGYSDLIILDRHTDRPAGDVTVFVKIQLDSSEHEANSLGQAMSRLLGDAEATGDVTIRHRDGETKAHRCILSARSSILQDMLQDMNQLDLSDIKQDTLDQLLKYIYTERVDLETNLTDLLNCSERLQLLGLKAMCERYLIDSIKPEWIPRLLLIADEYQCEELKKCALEYCEDNANAIQKTAAWKVLESVNPELFDEICEAGIGSSISSNLDSSDADN